MEVVSVSARSGHGLGKDVRAFINLIAGQGIEGDAHCGVTVKHRSRVAKDPAQPNLRQVHLIPIALFDDVAAMGFQLKPGELGENILTRGIDLLNLPRDALLSIGDHVVLEVTGLRNPCHQLNEHTEGLMHALLCRDADGQLIRKGGIMGIVRAGGQVRSGDKIVVSHPPGEKHALIPV